MLTGELKYIEGKDKVIVFPITKLNAVMDDTGKTLEEILQYLGNKGGIIILGEVDEVSDLPPTAEHNDAYFVGDDIYIYIGPNGGDIGTPNNAWLNKGPLRGPKGQKGDTGSPAGFGQIDASVDNNTSNNPTVIVTEHGPNTAKDIHFAFHGIKGPKGTSIESVEQTTTSSASEGVNVVTVTLDDDSTYTFQIRNGKAGVSSAVVSVDGTTGNPSVVADVEDGVLSLAFSGLKGVQGNPGMNNTMMRVVSSLPANPTAQDAQDVYLLYNANTGDYDRYILEYDGQAYNWVQAGSLRIDLADYQRKDDEVWLTQEEWEALEIKDITKTYNIYEEDDSIEPQVIPDEPDEPEESEPSEEPL